MFPFARIYTRQHKDDSFRYGKQQGPSLETTQGCSNSGVVECTEALFFLHNPPTEATWNITKKDCTGYSRAYRLGKDETAFVFSPCQTKSVSARTSFLHEFAGVPKICKLLYIGKVVGSLQDVQDGDRGRVAAERLLPVQRGRPRQVRDLGRRQVRPVADEDPTGPTARTD